MANGIPAGFEIVPEGFEVVTPPSGQLAPGNINLNNRPTVYNKDGSISTVRSIGVNFDGMEYLIPTVADDGRLLSDDEAIELFRKSGNHLGAFDSPVNASKYAETLHKEQEAQYSVPAGFEVVEEAPSFMEQVGQGLKTFGENTMGLGAGLADIASGMLTAPFAWTKAQYDVAMGGDPVKERQEMGETMGKFSPSAAFPSIRDNPTYQNMMKPFEWLEEGTDWAVEQAGGGDAAKLAVQGPLMFAPVPFAKPFGKAVGKGASVIDPALRKLDKPTTKGAPEGFEIIGETTPPREQVQMFEESPVNPQMDMFEVINPYDVGGHVSRMQEGFPTTVDPVQMELGGLNEFPEIGNKTVMDNLPTNPDDMYSGGIVQEVPDMAQGQLFAPEVQQQFRDLTNTIPGLERIAGEAPVETPVNNTKAPIEKVTENIPELGDRAKQIIYENLGPEQVTERAIGEKDSKSGEISRQFYSGANLAAAITESSLIKGVYNWMNQAEKSYMKTLQNKIIPIERDVVKLSTNEKMELANVLKDEMFGQQLTTPEQRAVAFKNNPKLEKAYTSLRQGLEDSFNNLNRGRKAAGLPPVDKLDYYVSSQWRGNFKSAAYVDGKLVGYLRDRSNRKLNASKAALEKQLGKKIEWRNDTTTGRHTPTDTLQASFMDALKLLDENDPTVQAFTAAMKEQMAAQGGAALGMLHHAEQKHNVRGFLGDRPGVKPERNAVDLLNSQLQYMKNTEKWANQQEAVAKAKEVLSNPELMATQPNNVAYAKDYVKNALGFGTPESVRNIESFISKSLGYDRDAAMAGLNNLRAFFYTKQLGLLNPKATLVQVTQPLFSIPHHLDLVDAGFKYNPVTHAGDVMSDFYKLTRGDWEGMSPEGRAALEYGKDNGILSMNVLDEIRNIGDSRAKRVATKVANINQIKVEEFGRTYTYLSAVHHLKQSGLKGEPLHLTAEAFTNRVMGDYRRFEQPMWMEKGGLSSRAAGTLKTFINNQYNNMVYFGKQASKGNYAPLAAWMGVQFALGGTLGMPGVETLSNLYDEFILPMLPKSQHDKSLRQGMLNNMDDLFAYGAISKATGMNLHGSLSQGNIGGMDSIGEGLVPFASDFYKMIASGASAALDPSDSKKWREFMYEVMPPHLKGAMENLVPSLTSEQGYSLNPRDDTRAMYKRNDHERMLRYFGATSLTESSTKDRAFEAQKTEKRIMEAKQALKDEYVTALENNDSVAMKEVIGTLSKWMGADEIAKFLITGVQDRIKGRSKDVFTRQMPESVGTISSQRKYQRIKEADKR